MWHTILDLFFPRTSLSGNGDDWITQTELRTMRRKPVFLSTQELRGMGVLHIDCLAAASTYDESPFLRTAIHRLKYKRIRAMARPLGRMMADASFILPPKIGECVLCPVPLHWTRYFDRGFNQSELLAREVAELLHMKVSPCLRRVRTTGHQAHRGKEDRRTAMHNAFAVRDIALPSRIILIDDVATTCSTLDECARILKEAGVMHVDALALALG
jgi:competence protein ComFC